MLWKYNCLTQWRIFNDCFIDYHCNAAYYFFIKVSGFLFATSKVATVIATAARMAK